MVVAPYLSSYHSRVVLVPHLSVLYSSGLSIIMKVYF